MNALDKSLGNSSQIYSGYGNNNNDQISDIGLNMKSVLTSHSVKDEAKALLGVPVWEQKVIFFF